jgi:hypothetical protein
MKKPTKLVAFAKGFVAVDTIMIIGYETIMEIIHHPAIGIPAVVLILGGAIGGAIHLENSTMPSNRHPDF